MDVGTFPLKDCIIHGLCVPTLLAEQLYSPHTNKSWAWIMMELVSHSIMSSPWLNPCVICLTPHKHTGKHMLTLPGSTQFFIPFMQTWLPQIHLPVTVLAFPVPWGGPATDVSTPLRKSCRPEPELLTKEKCICQATASGLGPRGIWCKEALLGNGREGRTWGREKWPPDNPAWVNNSCRGVGRQRQLILTLCGTVGHVLHSAASLPCLPPQQGVSFCLGSVSSSLSRKWLVNGPSLLSVTETLSQDIIRLSGFVMGMLSPMRPGGWLILK